MRKSILLRTLAVLVGIAALIACQEKRKPIKFPPTDMAQASMIPKPLKIIATHRAFGLDQNTVIYTSQSDSGFTKVGRFLAEKIQAKTQLQLPVNDSERAATGTIIYLHKSDSIALDPIESYQLYITPDSVIINSKTAEGAFRGIQTLRQLIPETSNDTLADHRIWPLPTGKIFDRPNFEYRGSMLDVARHFFSVSEVKKYIDILAYYKINRLHLHLSDDQGWRIEIKSWPKLTEIGGSTEVGGGKGGFYTQEAYKDLVRYAAERFITIIPEIDMPGHTNAASVSYPFLNGNGKTPKLYTGTNVGFSTFDSRNDKVYAFIDDVVREITAMTPGPYFHIGGDESHVTKKADYLYFIGKVNTIVKKYGKQMIGWDEIVHADIDPISIAQFWSNEKNAVAAVDKGLKVILSPGKKAYLDMQYDSLSKYGLHWAAYIPVDSAYIWTPEKYVKGVAKDHILGLEAPLWSETIGTMDALEYLAFPRMIGYAELGWSTEANRDWEDYRVRLSNQTPYLDRMKVKYYPSQLIDWKKTTPATKQ